MALSIAAAFFCSVVPAMAQATAPPLGTVRQFGALGGAGVTGSTGVGTSINGDVGSSPTASITNFPPSSTMAPYIVHFTNDSVVQQAHLDAITAYNNLFAQGTGAGATALGPQLTGLTLGPGVYRIAAAADLAAGGILTLNDPTGSGIFVFSVGTSLTANVLSSVGGTANPCNVFWQVG
ncbi:MAG: ice-binding family protein, partial [Thermoanaerobaculia bacterium]